jgi:hypothetical protein
MVPPWSVSPFRTCTIVELAMFRFVASVTPSSVRVAKPVELVWNAPAPLMSEFFIVPLTH